MKNDFKTEKMNEKGSLKSIFNTQMLFILGVVIGAIVGSICKGCTISFVVAMVVAVLLMKLIKSLFKMNLKRSIRVLICILAVIIFVAIATFHLVFFHKNAAEVTSKPEEVVLTEEETTPEVQEEVKLETETTTITTKSGYTSTSEEYRMTSSVMSSQEATEGKENLIGEETFSNAEDESNKFKMTNEKDDNKEVKEDNKEEVKEDTQEEVKTETSKNELKEKLSETNTSNVNSSESGKTNEVKKVEENFGDVDFGTTTTGTESASGIKKSTSKELTAKKVETPVVKNEVIEKTASEAENLEEEIKVTAIDGYSTTVGSDIQFKVTGDVANIDGLDGIDYSLSNGILTINCSEVTVLTVELSNSVSNQTFDITVNGIVR